MTYKFYKKFQTLFFILFIPVLIINQFGDKIPLIAQNDFIKKTIFYANPILSITILYFGIYAYKCKIKNKKTLGPIPIILMGIVLSLISFCRPVIGLLLLSDQNKEYLGSVDFEFIKKKALNSDTKYEERIAAAKYHYFHTGDSIEYRDKQKEKILFRPNKLDIKERQENIKIIEQNERIVKNLRSIVINLFLIAIMSCLGFLIFIRYYKFK